MEDDKLIETMKINLLGRSVQKPFSGWSEKVSNSKKELSPITPVDVVETTKEKSNENKKYESVNHPKHYNNYDVEVIDMMERIWGLNATIQFCQMNAFKYRMRMGTKPGVSFSEDVEKEQWYLDKAKELKSKVFDRNN